jgi:hypothetical protein
LPKRIPLTVDHVKSCVGSRDEDEDLGRPEVDQFEPSPSTSTTFAGLFEPPVSLEKSTGLYCVVVVLIEDVLAGCVDDDPEEYDTEMSSESVCRLPRWEP